MNFDATIDTAVSVLFAGSGAALVCFYVMLGLAS